jgi:NAD+--asparagine ADP-ribosyltransferase
MISNEIVNCQSGFPALLGNKHAFCNLCKTKKSIDLLQFSMGKNKNKIIDPKTVQIIKEKQEQNYFFEEKQQKNNFDHKIYFRQHNNFIKMNDYYFQHKKNEIKCKK